jgi:hypothetical protein
MGSHKKKALSLEENVRVIREIERGEGGRKLTCVKKFYVNSTIKTI